MHRTCDPVLGQNKERKIKRLSEREGTVTTGCQDLKEGACGTLAFLSFWINHPCSFIQRSMMLMVATLIALILRPVGHFRRNTLLAPTYLQFSLFFHTIALLLGMGFSTYLLGYVHGT